MTSKIIQLGFSIRLSIFIITNCLCRSPEEILYVPLDPCRVGEYFDSVILQCSSCPENQTVSQVDPFSCECKAGFITKTINSTMYCEKCPPNFVISENKKFCIECSVNQTYNVTTSKCGVCSDPNMISVDQYFDGATASSKQCIRCIDYFTADREANLCIPCHESFSEISDKMCSCASKSYLLIQGICILNSDFASIPDLQSSYKIDYDIGVVESPLFQDNYRLAAFGCSFYKNTTACHVVSNLCVLMNYNYDNELTPCDFYLKNFGDNVANIPGHIPWLYYPKNKAEKILSSKNLKAKFSFRMLKSVNNRLNLVMTQYSFTGKLLSLGLFEDTLNLCPEISYKMKNNLWFGETFQSSCSIPTSKVLFDYTMRFYDLYLQYSVGDETKLYPIPILNTNYVLNGVKTNIRGKDKWQLTRRFFMVDNISGKKRLHKLTQPNELNIPKVIRYCNSLEIIVQLRDDTSDGFIYPPYAIVHYNDLDDDQLRKLDHLEFSFKITYVVNFDQALNIISILLSVFGSFATILAFLKTFSWSKRSGRMNITTILHWVCIECGYLANTFFFVLFAISLFWVLTFKNQDVVWIFLPSDEQEWIIKQFLISAFSLKFVQVCFILHNQIMADLFIIDWEQPKIHSEIGLQKKISHDTGNTKHDPSVSIWRTYFIANEWNELQTHCKISVSFVLFILIFFLKVLSYEDIARHHPTAAVDDSPSLVIAPYSFISRFALSTSIFIISSVIQSIFMVTLYERYVDNKIQMFIDLCSMANISVLILNHHLYGYYIHGRAVNGEADLDMQSYYEQLKREEEDLCGRRGLEPSSECQTFEVLITSKFRAKYDSILDISENIRQGPSSARKKLDRIELCIRAHEQMKKFLTIFLQHAHNHRGLDFVVKEKYFLENVLDIELQDTQNSCIFYRDYKHSFDRTLLYGEETLFLLFEMMAFTFVDVLSTNFLLACFITFLLHQVIILVRYHGGRRNMVAKTLVDKRFLL